MLCLQDSAKGSGPSPQLYRYRDRRQDGLYSVPPPRTASTQHLYDRGIPPPTTKVEKRRARQTVYGPPVKPSQDTPPQFWGVRLPYFENFEFRNVDRMLNGRPRKGRKPKAGKRKKQIAVDIHGNDITEKLNVGRNAVWTTLEEREQDRSETMNVEQGLVFDLRPQASEANETGLLKGRGRKRKMLESEAEGRARQKAYRRQKMLLAGRSSEPVYVPPDAPEPAGPAVEAEPKAGAAAVAGETIDDRAEQTVAAVRERSDRKPDTKAAALAPDAEETGEVTGGAQPTASTRKGSASVEKWVEQVASTSTAEMEDVGATDHEELWRMHPGP
ncbi:hypothetical protein B0A50_05651 [Salinomyces thailandicus]|uniref:Uncharacterized protein n=1 Tax=Salinomyces thailandicus TaxID=706561 RepID=A0A4U0TV72_9PEZI|nr:hypothetical protein B0A50_05651 [Salinomyces thailandica]